MFTYCNTSTGWKCEGIQELGWNQVQCNTAKLLPEILEGTSLQLERDTKSPLRSIPDADIPEEARCGYKNF